MTCTNCKTALSLPATAVGKRVRCPKCKTVLSVPSSPRPPVVDPTRELSDPMVESEHVSDDDENGALPRLRPPEQSDELGRIGHFRVLKELGRGGMGIVYLAEDLRLLRPVALKVMLPRFAAKPQSKARFLREARTAAKIDNDHVIAIYEVDEEDGIPFLTMPVLHGEALNACIKREKTLPIPTIVRIGREICDGLSAAHHRGLVHRDLKPGNIWLESKGEQGGSSLRLGSPRVKILDFGLAKVVETDEHLTRTGIVLGTPAYMAPEQARNPQVDGRADLFSLGVILYQLATGRLPFSGHDTMSTLFSVCQDTPAPATSFRPDLPTDVNAVIFKLLEKDPAHRYPTAAAARDALDAIRPTQMSAAPVAVPVAPAAPVARPSAPRTSFPSTSVGPTRSSPSTPPETQDDPLVFKTKASLVSLSSAEIPYRPTAKQTARTRQSRRPLILGAALASVLGVAIVAMVVLVLLRPAPVEEQPIPEAKPAKQLGPAKKESPVTTIAKAPTTESGRKLDYAAERKAAEWVLSANGTVGVTVDSEEQVIKPGENLPENPFKVTGVNLAGYKQTLNNEFDCFKPCTQVRYLNLDEAKVSDGAFESFSNCVELRELHARGAMTDRRMVNLKHWNRLQDLTIYGSPLSDEGYFHLGHCKDLRHLDCRHLTDRGLASIGQCKELRFLDIGAGGFSAAGMAALRSFLRLEWLSLPTEALSEAGVGHLAECPSLHFLRCRNVGAAEIRRLSGLGNRLLNLEIYAGKLSDEGFEALEQFRSLRSLGLAEGGAPTEKGMRSLAKLADLRSLTIDCSDVVKNLPAAALSEFRLRRPNVALRVANGGDKTIASHRALQDWPESDEGGIAPWILPKGFPTPLNVPCTPAEAAKFQQAWADHLKVPVEFENSIGMKFRLIPPGDFVESFGDDRNALVRSNRPFYMGDVEVTWEQFKRFVDETGFKTHVELRGDAQAPGGVPVGTSWRDPGHAVKSSYPVGLVMGSDGEAFCRWLSKKEKSQYRLPETKEWEFAARGGGDGDTGWADYKNLTVVGWFSANAMSLPHSGREKDANPFGLYDVLGNMWEWTWDERAARHIVRGGAWGADWTTAKFAVRGRPDGPSSDHGFRVLKEIPAKQDSSPATPPLRVRPGQALSANAAVSLPPQLPGLRSWSLEPAQHTTPITHIVHHPSQELIAVGDELGHVRIWSTRGELRHLLLGHETGITGLAFTRDGERLVSASRDGQFRVWKVDTGALSAQHDCRSTVKSFSFSADDGAIAFSSTTSRLRYLNLAGEMSELEIGSGTWLIRSIAWSPDGTKVALNGGAHVAEIWTRDGKTNLARLEANLANYRMSDMEPGLIAWSPDGSMIAAGHPNEDKVHVWNARTYERLWTAEGTKVERPISWSSDSKRLLVPHRDALVVLDVANKSRVAELPGTSAASWSADGATIYSATGDVFDAAGAKLRKLAIASPTTPSTPGLSHDGKRLVLDDGVGALRIDPRTGALLGRWKTSVGPEPRWSPDDKRILTRSGAVLRILDAAQGDEATRIPHKGPVDWADWSPDGSRIATIGRDDGMFRVWDIRTGQVTWEYANKDGKRFLCWSPDGKQIAMADDAIKKIRIRDSRDGRVVREHGIETKAACALWRSAAPELTIFGSDGTTTIDFRLGWVERSAPLDGEPRLAVPAPDGETSLVHTAQRTIYRVEGKSTTLFGPRGSSSAWTAGCRQIVVIDAPTFAMDLTAARRLGTFHVFPRLRRWACVGPEGNYRGGSLDAPGDGTNPADLAALDELFVCVGQLNDGSTVTMRPSRFRERFGATNDPARASFLGW
jgi:serine/threonine protein kinase/WD40 repeat protein/formylglycine-generating enzyme required for sulfatase activity